MVMRHALRLRRPRPSEARRTASKTALVVSGASRKLLSGTRPAVFPTSESTGFARAAAPKGRGYLLTENGQAVFAAPSTTIGTGDFTIFAHIHVFATSAGYAYIIGTSGNYFSLSINHPSASGNIAVLIGGLAVKNSGISCASPGDYRIAAVRRGTDLVFYVNGVASSTITSSDDGASFTQLVINSYVPSGGYGATNVAFYAGGIDTRAWSDAEIRAFNADPRSVFAQIAVDEWNNIALAGSNGTISVTEIEQYRVFEGAAGSAQVTIAGSHTGITDTIQVQIETTGGAVVAAWQTLQSNVAEGAFFGTITVPRGGWYLARVRKANYIATSDLQAQQWGVGIIVGGMGQSQIGIWAGSGTATPDGRAVTHNGTSWSLMTSTGKYRNIFASTLIGVADCPVAVVKTHIDGAGIESFYDSVTGKTATYTSWESIITAMGGELSAMIWWQGEGDVAASRTKAQYLTDLYALLSQLRMDYGATLPVVMPQLGRTTYEPYTDALVEQIRDAQVEAAHASVNNYGISTIEFALDDVVHYGDAGQTAIALRLAQCVAEAYGDAAYSRSPAIGSVLRSGPTTIDVSIIHDGGTDITPSTGITGFSVLDNGAPVTISSAARLNASTVRLTLSTTPTGAVTLRYGYGANPTITGILRDNTSLALALETTDADVSVLGRKVLLNCIQRVGGAPSVSVTGLRWAFFDQSAPNALAAPAVTGTGESTDGAGVLEIDVIGTTLGVGDTGYLVTDTAAGVGFCGPVVVSG